MKRIPVSFVWLPERARQAHPRPLKPSNIFEFNNVINSSSGLRGLSKSNGREQLSVFSFAGGNLHWYDIACIEMTEYFDLAMLEVSF